MRAREISKIRKQKKLLKIYSDFELIELKNNLDDFKILLKSIGFHDYKKSKKIENKKDKKNKEKKITNKE